MIILPPLKGLDINLKFELSLFSQFTFRKEFYLATLYIIYNKKVNHVIGEYIKFKPEEIEHSLNLLSVVRKLERVGDQTKNISEEIIFYIEAKVLKHRTKNLASADKKKKD